MRCSKNLIWLVALSACCLLLFVTTQPTFGQDSEDKSNGHRHSSGIFGMMLSPFRATMKHARRLFGSPINSASDLVADGFNQIQIQTFQLFMSLYNKTYSPEEIPRRMALFFDRRKLIEQSVLDFAEGRMPFMMRENIFIDWDQTELKALTGVSPPQSMDELTEEEREAVTELRHQSSGRQGGDNDLKKITEPTVSRPFENSTPKYNSSVINFDDNDYASGLLVQANERIPASKDWRSSGCISTPINQLKCGACYAIATMSVVESMRCINLVSAPILSPQQIVDCATVRAGYQNHGCDGGWPTRVLKYLQDYRIAARSTCYPFVRRQNQCRLNNVRSISGCTVSSSPTDSTLRYKVLNNERDILYHVAKTGPVVTVMRATDKFLYYGSGIFDDPTCTRRRDDVDHAIVIVGYGHENGQDYWIIKNSWGTTDWGQDGYGKYKRGTNACSIGHWGWVVTG